MYTSPCLSLTTSQLLNGGVAYAARVAHRIVSSLHPLAATHPSSPSATRVGMQTPSPPPNLFASTRSSSSSPFLNSLIPKPTVQTKQQVADAVRPVIKRSSALMASSTSTPSSTPTPSLTSGSQTAPATLSPTKTLKRRVGESVDAGMQGVVQSGSQQEVSSDAPTQEVARGLSMGWEEEAEVWQQKEEVERQEGQDEEEEGEEVQGEEEQKEEEEELEEENEENDEEGSGEESEEKQRTGERTTTRTASSATAPAGRTATRNRNTSPFPRPPISQRNLPSTSPPTGTTSSRGESTSRPTSGRTRARTRNLSNTAADLTDDSLRRTACEWEVLSKYLQTVDASWLRPELKEFFLMSEQRRAECNPSSAAVYGHLCKRHAARLLGVVVEPSTQPRGGLGLFTLWPRKHGEIICEYKGRIMRQSQQRGAHAIDLPQSPSGVPEAQFAINAEFSTDGFGRYINDFTLGLAARRRLLTNCLFRVGEDCRPRQSQYKVFIEASKDIAASKLEPTELSVSYGTVYWTSDMRASETTISSCTLFFTR